MTVSTHRPGTSSKVHGRASMTRPGCMTTATVVRERTFCGLTKIDFGWPNQSTAIQIADDRARRPADASLADRVGTSGSPDHLRRKTCGSDAQYGQDQRHDISRCPCTHSAYAYAAAGYGWSSSSSSSATGSLNLASLISPAYTAPCRAAHNSNRLALRTPPTGTAAPRLPATTCARFSRPRCRTFGRCR